MSFRNNNDAWHEKEKAELRDKLNSALEELERRKMSDALKIQKETKPFVDPFDYTKNKKPEAEKKIVSYSNLFQENNFELNHNFNDDFDVNKVWGSSRPSSGFNDFHKKAGITFIIFCFISLFVGYLIHHEFYDIRDGFVTDKTYVAGYWRESCTTTNNHRRCSYYWVPPTWSVTVTFEGQSASWNVTESEYNAIEYGEWFCSRDILHSGPCVQNQPTWE